VEASPPRERRGTGERRATIDPRSDVSEATADLAARLFGPFSLKVRGVAVPEWPACRAKSLLKYLLLNRAAPVARQVVLDHFWPDADAGAARNSLHVALHRLRRLLSASGLPLDPVQCSDGHVRLNPQLTVWLDTERFEAGVEAAQALMGADAQAGPAADALAAVSAASQLERALDLVRGELVAGDRDEAWIEPLRQRLGDRHLLALHALASHRFSQGDAVSSMALGHRMLLIDPCNEDAHRLLMSCYDRLAQPARIERQYRACVQALRDALGVAPHPRTTTLYRSLFEHGARHCA
jgi:DNA-binding SARP family transcriptional activator